MLSFSMRLTEMAWISSGDRNVKSTASTSEDMGCAIFILATGQRLWPLTSQVQQEAMAMWLNVNLASYLVCNFFFLGGGVRQNLTAFLLP